MVEEVKSIELWRFCNENIKTNGLVCHGYLQGKYFSILLKTDNEISTWIRWHKRPNLLATPNVKGLRAQKLIDLILSHIPNNEKNEQLITQLKEMRQKNENLSIFSKTGFYSYDQIEEVREKINENKKNQALKKIEQIKQDAKDRNKRAEEEQAKKQAVKQQRQAIKQAERDAKQKAHKERTRLEQEAAKQRIQAQRNNKFLKDQERIYTKMLFSAPESEKPVIFKDGETAVILGHINKNFYRIKIGAKNPSFFITHNDRVRKMSIEEVQKILLSVHENLNQDGEFDNILERSISDYDKFRKLSFPQNKNIMRERIAISKNILILKGLLNKNNVLVLSR